GQVEVAGAGTHVVGLGAVDVLLEVAQTDDVFGGLDADSHFVTVVLVVDVEAVHDGADLAPRKGASGGDAGGLRGGVLHERLRSVSVGGLRTGRWQSIRRQPCVTSVFRCRSPCGDTGRGGKYCGTGKDSKLPDCSGPAW